MNIDLSSIIVECSYEEIIQLFADIDTIMCDSEFTEMAYVLFSSRREVT